MPIPRIEYTDESLDLVVENLALSGRNLFPNVVSMEAHNFMKFSPYNAIQYVPCSITRTITHAIYFFSETRATTSSY